MDDDTRPADPARVSALERRRQMYEDIAKLRVIDEVLSDLRARLNGMGDS